LEGEGTFSVHRRYAPHRNKTYGMPIVSAWNTDYGPLKILQILFGGNITEDHAGRRRSEKAVKRKACWRWRVTYRNALKVVDHVYIYLRGEKKRQADRIIKFYEQEGGVPGKSRVIPS